MMRAHRPITKSLVTLLGILAGGLLLWATPAMAAAPAVVGESVPSPTPFEARLEATVNAGGETTECHFQYGKASVSEHPPVSCEQVTIEGGEQGVALTVTGLESETTYHYRVLLKNKAGEAEGAGEFTTLSLVKPAIESESVFASATTATLVAQIDPEYQTTSCKFLYGTDPSLTTSTVVPCGGSLGDGGSGTEASVALTGLKADETYYYRVISENETSVKEGKPAEGPIQSFATVLVPQTGAVGAITATTATFNGELTPLNPSLPSEYFFYYNTGTGPTCNGENNTIAVSAGTAGTVSTPVSELQPNRSYTVCLVSSNAYGSEMAITPAYFATPAAPPSLREEGTLASSGGVEFSAKVNPNNQDTTCKIQYVEAALYDPSAPDPYGDGGSTPCAMSNNAVVSSFGDYKAQGEIGELVSNKTYHYRVLATNATGTTYGPDQTFTVPGPLVVSTSAASEVGQSSANVTGTVDPEGVETYYYYQYGPTTEYGQRTAPGELGVDVGEGTTPVHAPATLVPLTPGITYHYRLVAWNEYGTSYGQDGTFTALAGLPPSASTGPASGVSTSEATLSGTVNPQTVETSYRFEYGTTTEYGTQAFGTAVPEQGIETVTLSLRGLDPSTTYHYRLVASSPAGTSYGEDQTFTTPGILDPLVFPATAPLITAPTTAFPAEKGTSTTKSLTNVQKLANALKACKKDKSKKKRMSCEAQAHKKYGAAKKDKKK